MAVKAVKQACFVVALLCALPAGADELILRNGAVFNGVIRDHGSTVVITMDSGSMTFQSWQVKEMRITGDPLRDYVKKQKTAKSAADWYELGTWARNNGLSSRSKEAFRETIKLDTDHAGARSALGYLKREGQWMTSDEVMVARGFMKLGVRWVHRETYEKQKMIEARRKIEHERQVTAVRIARMKRDVELARVKLEKEQLEAERQPSHGAYDQISRRTPRRFRMIRPIVRRPVAKECTSDEEKPTLPTIVVPSPSCNGRGGSRHSAVALWPASITGSFIDRR